MLCLRCYAQSFDASVSMCYAYGVMLNNLMLLSLCVMPTVLCSIISVTLNFDKLPMTHSIERNKAKHINWKFEDVGFKRQFYQMLDSMIDAAPAGLLRVNRGADANRLTDLLTFMSNAILKSGMLARIYLGCGNLKNSLYQGGMSEQRN